MNRCNGGDIGNVLKTGLWNIRRYCIYAESTAMKPFLIILFLISTLHAAACSCHQPTIAEGYSKSVLVFYGRYLGLKDTVDQRFKSKLQLDQFSIEALYKGLAPGDQHIVGKYLENIVVSLHTDCGQTSCGQCFEPGTYYMVYARYGFGGGISSQACLGTRAIHDRDFTTWDGKDEKAELLALAARDEAAAKRPMTGYKFLFPGIRNTLYPQRDPYNFEAQYLEKLNASYKETLHTYRYVILVLTSLLAGMIMASVRRWRQNTATA